jgi:hypothetical protein
MNKRLAENAAKALTIEGFASEAGWCMRFVRQVIQATYGHDYDSYFRGSAYETMLAFKRSGYAVAVESGSVVGDILFKGRKTSGYYGHVGIRIAGNKVAENSSSHTSDKDREARHTRSLKAYGDFELIVRLPEK